MWFNNEREIESYNATSAVLKGSGVAPLLLNTMYIGIFHVQILNETVVEGFADYGGKQIFANEYVEYIKDCGRHETATGRAQDRTYGHKH